MTVWECMEKLGRHEKVAILTARGKKKLAERISASEYRLYSDEYLREVYEAILEKTAVSVDLEQMIIYCKE